MAATQKTLLNNSHVYTDTFNYRIRKNVDVYLIMQLKAKNVILLCSICISLLVPIFFDYNRVNTDFLVLKRFLSDYRIESIDSYQKVIVKFEEKQVSVVLHDKVIDSVHISTLQQVNYDTTLGNNMIIFQGGVTSGYNLREHGGDIRLESFLGFRKNIAVNCAGLVQEGIYPEK